MQRLLVKPSAATLVAVASGLLLAACSGSSGREATTASAQAATGTASETAAATTTTTPGSTSTTAPASEPSVPIMKGKLKITPRRTRPPAERLPAFQAVRVTSADYPAGLAAAPDGRIFYAELWGGEIRVIRRDGTVDPEPWADVNAKFGIRWTELYHGGLSGIAFDPDFERNRFVYVVTQVPDEKTGFAKKSLVIRYKELKGRGTAPRVILTLPAAKFDNTYSLVFGPDGMLYVPTGFLGTGRSRGADPLADLRGKILRVTPAGRAPADNPYGARAPRVWALGFKNTFDLAFLPKGEAAIGGDNGTVGHDEINLLMPGHDYGYPEHEGITRGKRLTSPMYDYGKASTAPVGIIYYRGRRFPALRGRFLMCENHGDGMLALRIDPSDPGKLLNMTPLVPECTVDIVATRDGSIYFSDAGAVYRLAAA
jgi:glucose/arabinose dehydrogenase